MAVPVNNGVEFLYTANVTPSPGVIVLVTKESMLILPENGDVHLITAVVFASPGV
jgi:hypothetical protein